MAVPPHDPIHSRRAPSPTTSMGAWLERLRRQHEALLRKHRTPEHRDRLAQITTAMGWFTAGFYGTCSVCGQQLDPHALDEDPADMVCDRCTETTRSRRHYFVAQPAPPSPSPLPAEFGLVSLHDDDDVRQRQFEAAARAASAKVDDAA